MNPVLIFLVLLGAVALWFILSFIFYPLGQFFYHLWKDAMTQMDRDEWTEDLDSNVWYDAYEENTNNEEKEYKE